MMETVLDRHPAPWSVDGHRHVEDATDWEIEAMI